MRCGSLCLSNQTVIPTEPALAGEWKDLLSGLISQITPLLNCSLPQRGLYRDSPVRHPGPRKKTSENLATDRPASKHRTAGAHPSLVEHLPDSSHPIAGDQRLTMQRQLHIIPRPTTKPPATPLFRGPLLVVVAVLAILGGLAVVAAHRWPFTRDAVVRALQEQSGGRVQVAGFRQTYFPHPGCVADAVIFRRDSDQALPPFITIRRLIIVGSYTGVFTRRVEQVRAEGMHLLITHAGGSEASALASQGISLKSGIAIGEIVADGALVEIEPEKPDQGPLMFPIQKLSLNSIYDNHPLSFRAVLRIPEPPGDLSVTGQFGPWKSGDGGRTPLSGAYTLEHADLGVFGGIAGIVSATGKFNGVLQHLDVTGTTDTPGFELTRNRHRVHLTTSFRALVDGLNGDVALDPVIAHWGRTTIVAKTDIEGQSEGHGKTVAMTAYSTHARTEDLLRLFTRDNPPPMTGEIVFRARVTLPPEKRPFLERVRLQGDFGIAGARYNKFETQKNVDVLSARARGEADKVEDRQEKEEKHGNYDYDPGRVLSNLKGHVVLRDSIANLTHVSFDVPGASAVVSGTYNLKSEQINLHGPVRLDAPLSQATTGVKSFLLKIVQPLVHQKKQKGSIVEVKVGGTYHSPTFEVLPIPPK